LTLDWERWTLTQSSAWAAVLVELGLADGLPAMKASSEAETVADDEGDPDGDEDDDELADGELVPDDGELVPDGDPVPEGEVDGEPELDGGGDSGVLVGALLGLVLDAGAVGEAELDEDEGDGEGVGVLVGCGVGLGVGVGVGVGVLAAGSTWHLAAVLAPVLVEVPGLGEAAARSTVTWAAPGPPVSTPKVRKPPASVPSTAARTCARRMKFALSTLIIGSTVCSSGVRRRLGDGWV
jgi:hypothetical protein